MLAIECAEELKNGPHDPIVSDRHGNQQSKGQSNKADNWLNNTTVFQFKNDAQNQSR
jgi:hypothetical protein